MPTAEDLLRTAHELRALAQGAGDLPTPALVELLGAADAVAEAAAAARTMLLGRVDAAGAWAAGRHRSCASWWASVSSCSLGTARAQVHLARALASWLPATGRAVAAGSVSVEEAAVVQRGLFALAQVDDPALPEADATLAGLAPGLDAAQLRQVTAHLVEVVGRRSTREGRQVLAQARRGLTFADCFDGVAVSGLLTPVCGAQLRTWVESHLQPPAPGETTTAAHRRHDALATALHEVLGAGLGPRPGGHAPQLWITAHLSELQAGPRGSGSGGEVSGGGRLSPTVLAELACDAAVGWVALADPGSLPAEVGAGWGRGGGGSGGSGGGLGDGGAGTGGTGRDGRRPLPPPRPPLRQQLLDQLPPALGGSPREVLALGRTARLASPAQLRALTARDGGCAVPGCDAPPSWTQAHHLQHWLDGGATDLDNLALVCRSHHTWLHAEQLTLRRGSDGHWQVEPYASPP